jgi:3-oxoacyl-[acyl-carrier protein] reductase
MNSKRCALVTGASGGLGREIAVSLASAAEAVYVHFHRDRKGAEETARRIRDGGAETAVLQADLSSEEAARGLVAEAVKLEGRLDILINNVGPIMFKPWNKLSADDWEKMFRTNLWAAYFCLTEALPGMRARRFGRIVNLGFGRVEQLAAFPTILPYAAAKTGLLLLTRTAAAECRGTNVTVNMVSPGLLRKGILPAAAKMPSSALGSFSDVSAAVRFLISAESRHITGANIPVAGTWKM